MKILHIIQEISSLSAGPTYSVTQICRELARNRNYDVEIISSSRKNVGFVYSVKFSLFPVSGIKTLLSTCRLIKYYISKLGREICIVHEHGIWRLMNILPLFYKGKSTLVWSPRGMLSHWSLKHRWMYKCLFWYLLQRPALKRVDCFHVTSMGEMNDLRKLGFTQPIAIVSNGVDIPDEKYLQVKKERVVLFLGRIHKVKGVHLLLDAWQNVAKLYPEWKLKIAGEINSSYAHNMHQRIKDRGIERVEFVGGLYNEEKSIKLASASLFVLPSYSENFGVAIAESLAHGTPVITTNNTPWSEVNEKFCGWQIDNDLDTWCKTLELALGKSERELLVMGLNGRAWMEEGFSWSEKASEMRSVYDWLVLNSPRPDFVYLV